VIEKALIRPIVACLAPYGPPATDCSNTRAVPWNLPWIDVAGLRHRRQRPRAPVAVGGIDHQHLFGVLHETGDLQLIGYTFPTFWRPNGARQLVDRLLALRQRVQVQTA
jgi:hypothetical protein